MRPQPTRRRAQNVWTLGVSVALAVIGLVPAGSLLGAAADSKDKGGDSQSRLDEMKRLAGSFHVRENAGKTAKPATLLAEPLHRWNDPARRFQDGTLWTWTERGRPVAALTIELYSYEQTGSYWALELVSLSERPLNADGASGYEFFSLADKTGAGDGSLTWRPNTGGLVFKPFPGASAPGSSEPERLRQMKDLAKRVTAHEFYGKPLQRYDLRPFPRPIHRYADRESGIIDGAVFLFAYGTNPEVIMLLEARAGGSGAPTWNFGLARLTTARPVAEIDHREVWNPGLVQGTTPFEPYTTTLLLRKRPKE